MDRVSKVLVLEDDVEWFPDVWERLDNFMNDVPIDWEQLMLGGQHLRPPVRVSEGVARCRQTERTHAYALRGKAIKSLLALWRDCTVHIDWEMGRKWQKDWKVYAPTPFLFGQGAGRSDISGRVNNPQYWNEPKKNHPVIVLDAPAEVVKELRERGWHTGFTRNKDDYDVGLVKIANEPKKSLLRTWIHMLGGECASMPGSVVTIWHPGIAVELVKQVHPNVITIQANTVEEALQKFKE